MPAPIFHGRVENGKPILNPADLDDYRMWLRSLEGKECDIIIRKARKDRSNAQNRYYWKCVVELLAEHLGYDREETHIVLRQRFLTDHTNRELPRVRSTAGLSTIEFSDYVENCRRLAAELGVVIPNPGDAE